MPDEKCPKCVQIYIKKNEFETGTRYIHSGGIKCEIVTAMPGNPNCFESTSPDVLRQKVL